MHAALRLLDKAIEMGRQELAHLSAGEVDKAEALAFGRDGVLHDALAPDALSAPAEECLDSLLEKLRELKGLQTRIIDEARRLQQNIGSDIRRMGQEQKRHKGYGRMVRPRRIQNMYLNRQS
jgi:hypothetical protein